MRPLLNDLLDPVFSATVSSLPSPAAVRRYLARTRHVGDIREALRKGNLTEEAIRQFTGELMSGFQPGQRFPHEPALSALSVALETRRTDFASEYTSDLAELELTEMPTAIRVARLSLEERFRLWPHEAGRPPISVQQAPPQQTPAHEAHS